MGALVAWLRATSRRAMSGAWVVVAVGTVGCQPPDFAFDFPLDLQLSAVGSIPVAVTLPPGADTTTLAVMLDGIDVTSQLTVIGLDVSGALDVLTEGAHTLTATVLVGAFLQLGTVTFDTVALNDVDECEVLNNDECMLPYPSSRFLAEDTSTPTGFRVNLPDVGMPVIPGAPIDPAPINELDGFSPFVQIMVRLTATPDLELSDVSRLLEPGCCGQSVSLPWIDTRTYTARSLDADSPTVLIHADTGERVLHFVELDARADAMPDRQVLVIRPAEGLRPGGRYVVGVRNLVDTNGVAIEPEPVFRAIRGLRPTTIPAVADRQVHIVSSVLPVLSADGVLAQDLILAFDFVVQSEHQLTHQMLSMRDQAYAWLDDRLAELAPGDPNSQTFSITQTDDFVCSAPDGTIGRRVFGFYDAPLFLEGPLDVTPAYFMNADANDTPVMNGIHSAPFTINIPCAALSDDPDAIDVRPLLLGHGLFGAGSSFSISVSDALGDFDPSVAYLSGATDWRGLSGGDAFWLLTTIFGSNGAHQLNNFAAFPDRLRQGMLNTLVLSRMMEDGFFNNDPSFQTPSGAGVFPGPTAEQFYYGVSLGGIMGTYAAALNPDIERYALDVPAVNFSMLLQRSTQFALFESIINGLGLTDPIDQILGLQVLQELWISAEPGGYARHITSDPLPGSGGAKRILYTAAWLDKQVSNQATEIAARTLAIPTLDGSIQQGFVGIPDVSGPVDSAFILWDTGSFDILDPLQAAAIPPLANEIPSSVCDPHTARPSIPAGVEQTLLFLRPGGQVVNTCDGLCDAGTPDERPGGLAPELLCDPLNP